MPLCFEVNIVQILSIELNYKHFLIAAVNEISAGQIRDCNSAVFYGLGQIQINLKP
jgi:hypothetical protein